MTGVSDQAFDFSAAQSDRSSSCHRCGAADAKFGNKAGFCCWHCFQLDLGGDGTFPEPQNIEEQVLIVAELKREIRETFPVETARLLAEVEAFVRRFVVLPSPAEYAAVALFVMHTHAFEAAHATPYLVVESPEKQSGKTRLLEVLALVCRRPVKVASITAAALFQTVARGHPTLLIDEVDAIFGGNGERNEDLRGVLNAGNAPGSPVIRGGKDGEPVSYDVFCPKVLAGIATGRLPDTVRDRAVILSMDRKLRTEQVERLRRRRIQTDVDKLCADLGAWAEQVSGVLVEYDLPEPLEQISDRLEEAWEPLLAIADLAGGEYAARARAAAVDLAVGVEGTATASHTLLFALRGVFGARDKVATRDLLAALNEDAELPFGSWSDGGLTAYRLGQLLKPYRISPRTIKLSGGAAGPTAMGYQRKQFEAVWDRYGGPNSNTPTTSLIGRAISAFSSPTPNPEGVGTKTPETPDNHREVLGVLASDRPGGPGELSDDDLPLFRDDGQEPDPPPDGPPASTLADEAVRRHGGPR